MRISSFTPAYCHSRLSRCDSEDPGTASGIVAPDSLPGCSSKLLAPAIRGQWGQDNGRDGKSREAPLLLSKLATRMHLGSAGGSILIKSRVHPGGAQTTHQGVRVCVCKTVHARVRVRARVHVRARVRARACVRPVSCVLHPRVLPRNHAYGLQAFTHDANLGTRTYHESTGSVATQQRSTSQ